MGKWRFYIKPFVSICGKRYKRRSSKWNACENTDSKQQRQTFESWNYAVINYEVYEFSKEEFIFTLLKGIILVFLVSYLFYENVLISLLFTPLGIFYIKKQKKQKIAERKWNLNMQFREGLTALLGALNAGYSIENGFVVALRDLKFLYGKEEPIIKEFEGIVAGIKINENIETLLLDFANRCQIEDIEVFAEVFSVSKRTGGDLISIMSETLNTINDKIEIKRQIKTMVSAKKLEARIMSFVPLLIVIYMKLFSGGLLEPLYHNFLGIVIMTGLLIAYVAAYELSEEIVNIEI